ncbi:MAG: glycosyltransferase [Arenicellales bacterium]
MQALSQNFKVLAYRWLVFGKFRWFAKPLYSSVLNSVLAWHRLIDVFHPLDKGDVSDLSLIIKTFERPYAIKRLVESIRRRYPSIEVIVVDDSRIPLDLADVTILKMPYDSGISAGRNAALDICNTSFFLLLDDDFVFSYRQNLSQLCAYMNSHAQVDILGGKCIDLPLYIKHDFQKGILPSSLEAKAPLGKKIGRFEAVDKVQNYFIGRTTTIKAIKWNPLLKVMEHTEFFTRAKGHLTSVYDPDMFILHAK